MPNSKHLTHGISNLVSLITKTKLGLSLGLILSCVESKTDFTFTLHTCFVGEVNFEGEACSFAFSSS
jgi:hypothetical protein